jgi:hypothetical protein
MRLHSGACVLYSRSLGSALRPPQSTPCRIAASPRVALPLILAIVGVEYLAARAKIVRNNNGGSRTDEVNSARPTDAIAYSDSDLHVDNMSGETLFNGLNSQVFDLLQQSLSNICA